MHRWREGHPQADPPEATPPPAPAPPTPSAEATTPPAPTPPPTPTPPPDPVAITPPPEPVAEAAIEGVGPFKSIAAYCKDVKSKFVRADCISMQDGGESVCTCGIARDQIRGKRKIGPLPEATGLASAELVLVARSAGGYGDCDLAIQTANGRGWFMVPALMSCTEAPIAHDAGLSVKVNGFDVTREDDTDVLTLAWTETTSDYDIDGKVISVKANFTTRCTIGADTLPRCARPTKL